MLNQAFNFICKFLSTPSGWRATWRPRAGLRHTGEISIHALRVEGDRRGRVLRSRQGISIHALRVEGDRSIRILLPQSFNKFLSTPSGWRATIRRYNTDTKRMISIHALRVEGDSKNGQSFRLFLRKREKNLPL